MLTTREIHGHLEEIYGIEVSPTLISNVTEAVLEEVKVLQSSPLEEAYPIVKPSWVKNKTPSRLRARIEFVGLSGRD